MAAALLALIKAIPAVRDLFFEVQRLYYQAQEAADSERYAKKKQARIAILKAMQEPGKTEQELDELRFGLYTLNAK